MDVLAVGKIDNRIYTALLLLLLLVLIFIGGRKNNENQEITIFVLDTEINRQYLDTGGTEYGENITHGTQVARLILDETTGVDLRGISVGKDLENYISGLRQIRDFKLRNPEKKVLVNISLAFNEDNSEHQKLIRELNNTGVIIIAAAGNDGQRKKVYPAGYSEEVITVAGAKRGGRVSTSNYGEHIDLAASDEINLSARIFLPGGPIYRNIQSYGTSFSAPRVTGLIARVLTLKPELGARTAVNMVLDSCRPVDSDSYRHGLLGAGVPDRSKVLSRVDKFYFLKDFVFRYLRPLAILTVIFFLIYISGIPVLILSLFLLLFQTFIPPGLYISPRALIYFFLSLLAVRLLTYWSNSLIFISSIFFYILIVIYFPALSGIYFILLPVLFLTCERVLKFMMPKRKTSKIIKTLTCPSELLRKCSRRLLEKRLKNGSVTKDELVNQLCIASSGKLKKNLIYILAGCKSPPLRVLLSYDQYSKMIGDRLSHINNQKTAKNIIDILHCQPDKKRKSAVSILSHFPAESIIPAVVDNLLHDHCPEELLWTYFAIIRDKGKEAFQSSPEVFLCIRKYTEKRFNPWTRMYALRTLAAIHPEKEQLNKILLQFTDDNELLVKTEARGLLEERS